MALKKLLAGKRTLLRQTSVQSVNKQWMTFISVVVFVAKYKK